VVGLLSGCASGQTQTDASQKGLQPRRIAERGDSFQVDLPPEGGVHATQIRGTPQEIFPHLILVYEELGIPVETIESAAYLLGNAAFRARRQIAQIPMGRIVDCGFSVTGARANTDMITFDLKTQIRATGPNNVVVETIFTAIARSTGGSSGAPMNCTSQGALERRIASGVQDRIGS
jgi:hypothetical protein